MEMKERIKQTFFALNDLVGVSGRESDVARYCRDAVKPYADKIEVMRMGNVIATFNGKRPGPSVMIAAHMDEIGLIIKHITDDGFLLFERIGGTQLKVLPGRRIRLRGTDGPVIGVVGLTPGHVMTPQEAATIPAPKDSYIDIGATSREEAESWGIHVGTTGVYDSPAVEMRNPDLINGRCADDRINCAILIELCKELKDMDFGGTVHILFSVQEEAGTIGAPIASNHIQPDYFIALDTFPAGGTPDVTYKRLPVRIGEGPVMSLCDASMALFMLFNAHERLVELTQQVVAEKNIPIQYITMCEDMYGTDALGVIKTGSGCPCLEFGMPRRYSHSPIELFDIKDTVRMYDLLAGIIAKNEHVTLDFIKE